MYSIMFWDDFRPYGITYLTGESCGLGVRGLFEINEHGWSILDKFFSNTHSRNLSHKVGTILLKLEQLDLAPLFQTTPATHHNHHCLTEIHRKLSDIVCDQQAFNALLTPLGMGLNSMANTDGSIMLPVSIFRDLAIFTLLDQHPDVVLVIAQPKGGIHGYDQEHVDTFAEAIKTMREEGEARFYERSKMPGDGLRHSSMIGGYLHT